MKKKINKSSITGQFVSDSEVKEHPESTYAQTVETGKRVHEHCASCDCELGFNEAKTFIPEKNAVLCDECAKDYHTNESESEVK